MVFVSLIAGLVLLALGGDTLVRGAVSLAQRLGVSPLMIGLTLVGFGTSSPELLTSVQAALAGSPGIAIGNVVGSNIVNILLILGAAAVVLPVATSLRAMRRDGAFLTLSTLALIALVLHGEIGRLVGAALLVLMILYVLIAWRQENGNAEAQAKEEPRFSLWLSVLLAVGGLALTVLGARLLVSSAIELARATGVSETVIGLTVVALGTSLPELVTSVMAGIRGQSDVAFGNIVGSNLFNILGVLGVTALIRPIVVPAEIAAFDIWVMGGATALLLVFALTHARVTRMEGAILFVGYGAYVSVLVAGEF